MSAWTRSPLRLRLALAAALPVAATAGLAALMLEGGSIVWAVVGLLAALATGALVWFVASPLTRLVEVAGRLDQGEITADQIPVFTSELASPINLIHSLLGQIQDLAANYQADCTELSRGLALLTDGKSNPVPVRLSASFPELTGRVRVAYDELCKQTIAVRQRLNLSLRILQGLPEPVFATDSDGAVRYLNPAAEKLFGVTNTSVLKKPVTSLLMVTPPTSYGVDPEPEVSGSAAILEWLRRGSGGTRIAAGMDTRKRPFLLELTATPSTPNRDAVVCILARDLTGIRHREAEERAQIRANVCKQLLGRYLSESEEAIRSIDAQARLLSAEAKQSGQRDAMLPKLTTLRNALARMEVFAGTASWMERFHWGNPVDPSPTEFKAIEVVNLVADRLGSRFRSRNNLIKIDDQGGWVFADAEWLETALLGVMTHICDSNENAAVELHLRRLAASDQRPQPVLEFHIPDAGPALTSAMLEAIDHPFGGRQAAPLDQFDAIGGFPLGLVVARRLVENMGGELRFGTAASGRLELYMVLPTRIALEGLSVAPTQVTEVAPFEETVAGWRLGNPMEPTNHTVTRS